MNFPGRQNYCITGGKVLASEQARITSLYEKLDQERNKAAADLAAALWDTTTQRLDREAAVERSVLQPRASLGVELKDASGASLKDGSYQLETWLVDMTLESSEQALVARKDCEVLLDRDAPQGITPEFGSKLAQFQAQ